jgi:hypothetical protein
VPPETGSPVAAFVALDVALDAALAAVDRVIARSELPTRNERREIRLDVIN